MRRDLMALCWDVLSQHQKQFYVNFQRRWCLQNTRDDLSYTLTCDPRTYTSLAYWDRYDRTWWTEATWPDCPYWIENTFLPIPALSLTINAGLAMPQQCRQVLVQTDKTAYAVAKLKPRRSYWTGRSLPRRNLAP